MEVEQYNTMMKSLKREKKLEEALRQIKIQTTENIAGLKDIAGLTRDEALDVITWVRELAEEALRKEV